MARTKDLKLRSVICKMYFTEGKNKTEISRILECSYSFVLKVIKEKEDEAKKATPMMDFVYER